MRLLLATTIACVVFFLPGADTTPAPETPAKGDAASLLAKLPAAPSLVIREDAAFWDDGAGTSYRLTSVNKDGALVDTEIGPVIVPKALLADNRTDCLTALPKLIATASAGKVAKDAHLTLAEGVMTGIHLRSDSVLVLTEGVLTKVDAGVVDRATDRKAIATVITAAKAALVRLKLENLAHRAVDDVLDRLTLKDDARKFEQDEVLPSFARRVVRNGWAKVVFGDDAVGEQLRSAVETAEAMRPISLFQGQGLRLAQMENAFGQQGWELVTPSRTSFARNHPSPMYVWGIGKNLILVVDLPAGSDPMKDASKAMAARLHDGAKVVATWTREGGLQADLATWRVSLPAKGRFTDDAIVEGFLPPHLVIIDLDGDVRFLITTHGLVVPPRDTSTQESERFLVDAAKVLPDAPHLDLVGEYIFYYVYDSPDSRHPQFIGNKGVKSDIHQTAYQTLATVAGGVCRGDCDDLSELYQSIAEHQGRTAHVITLPSHAALAFAEQKGKDWHVYILQTGQPKEFVATELPEALRKAYLSFDEGDSFDPNGLGLLLRFTGENTRGSWRLSWRIFSEAAYAKTMIDVQKDWHFSTYQRGITKMLKLIADGDDDTANYRELSGLYSFTGQEAKAAEYHQKALDRTTEPESRLYASTELVNHLFEAGKSPEARTVAERLLNQDLPTLQKSLGPRVIQFGFQLASFCSEGKAFDLAERTIKDTMLEDLSERIEQVGQWLRSPQFDPTQWERVEPLRRMQSMYVATALGVIKGRGLDALKDDQVLQRMVRSVQDWLNNVAFHDVNEVDDVLARYATAGQFYAAVMGQDRLLALLESTSLATDAKHDHKARVGGLAQVTLDLPWIRSSPNFWFGLLAEAVGEKDVTIDRPKVLGFAKHLAEAYANAQTLGIEDPWLDGIAHQGAVVAALLSEDDKALRERLRHVTAKDDKRLRDDTAQWLGDCAPHLSKEWFTKVLKAWVDECDYKPKYFWIAWRAALSHAPDKALMAAKLAKDRFKDDPAFSEEEAFMRQVLAPQTKR